MTATDGGSALGLSFRAMTMADLTDVLVNEVAAYPYPWTRGNFEDCLKERRDCWLLLADARQTGSLQTGSRQTGSRQTGSRQIGSRQTGSPAKTPAVVGHGVLSVAVGEAHVLNVCVAPACQGQGFGRALLDHLLGRALALRAEVVFLEVRPSNGVAIALYESVGFNEIGRRRNYYPAAIGHEDALVMALDLRVLDPGFGNAFSQGPDPSHPA